MTFSYRHPSVHQSSDGESSGPLAAHLAVAEHNAERSITLLKNAAGTLPLTAHTSMWVLVTGFAAIPTTIIAPTVMVTYDDQAVSLHALARVLFGEVNPGGTLPITITTPPPSQAVLYPFGYGLRYQS